MKAAFVWESAKIIKTIEELRRWTSSMEAPCPFVGDDKFWKKKQLQWCVMKYTLMSTGEFVTLLIHCNS